MISRSNIDDMEYFSGAKEIAEQEDRVEIDVHITGWEKKVRIRALSFAQMEKVNRMSRITKTDAKENKISGEMDHAEFTYWTLVEGVVIPHMSYPQAKQLADNNGEFVRELVDEIWGLGRINKKMWDDFIDEQKRLAAIEKTGNPDATSDDDTEDTE